MPLNPLLRVTEDPFARRMSRRAPWTAHLEFHVTGTSDSQTALDSIPYELNDPFSEEASSLKCEAPYIIGNKSGDGYWVVGVDFSQPEMGVFLNDAVDPLQRTSRISMQPLWISTQVDIDLDGNKIVNPAGDRFDPPTQEILAWEITVKRWEPFFDLGKAQAFSHSENSNQYGFFGYTIPKYHSLCRIIYPAVKEFDTTATCLPIRYVFNVLFRETILGPRPWQHNFLAVGTQCWGNFGVTGGSGTLKKHPLCDPNNNAQPIQLPVPLDLDGKPMSPYDYLQVSDGKETVDPADDPEDIGVLDVQNLTNCFRMMYRKVFTADHAALGL